jgi:sugar O-acyltransferase (sialic acid O-acetyltransferase NeuD family)
MKNLIIYGNGKIAKVIYQYTKKKYNVIGFTVEEKFRFANLFENKPLVSFENIEEIYDSKEHLMIIAVGYVEMNDIRQKIFNEVKFKGYNIINFIDKSVIIHDDIKIGVGNIILDNVSIQPGATIGDNNFIWSNATIAHGCVIHNDSWIASGATIGGDTILDSGCFIGLNSTIGHNIQIAKNTFIGANCLVTKNTSADSVYVSKDSNVIRIDSKRFLKFSSV